jgi:DNA-binding transcriptional MerR regulator
MIKMEALIYSLHCLLGAFMTEYSKRDIAKILGRSHRNITYWTDFGLVIPDVQPSQGRGVPRIYSERNLIEFGMIDILVKDFGVSLDSIQHILKVLREGEYKQYMGKFGFPSKEEKEKGIYKFKVQAFRDFYKNPDWGHEKELIYVENLILHHDGLSEEMKEIINEDFYDVIVEDRYYCISRSFFVKDPGSSWDHLFEMAFDTEGTVEGYGDEWVEHSQWVSRGGSMKIIWLSGVRNSSLKKVGITLPPFEEPPF